jgi:hypothetical protein
MGKRYPAGVVEVFVYSQPLGFSYTGRDKEGQIIYECPRFFRSRWHIREEVKRRWPRAKLVFS